MPLADEVSASVLVPAPPLPLPLPMLALLLLLLLAVAVERVAGRGPEGAVMGAATDAAEVPMECMGFKWRLSLFAATRD